MNAIELFIFICEIIKMRNDVDMESLRGILGKPIVFVGLMGAGKTSLGKAFAQSLGLEFIDSDDVIVAREGRSIAEIFENSGEPYFRALERKIIIELAQEDSLKIIGTGGGAFMNEETRQVIKENAFSIFLEADLDVLEQRIGTGEGRPLFKGKEIRNVLSELIEARYSVYKEADLCVETKNEPMHETLNRVQQTLYSHLRAG